MEAYQAYYNTNENQQQPSSQGSEHAKKDSKMQDEMRYPNEAEGKGQNMKIINNIMHINHSGANINIMCGSTDQKAASGQQNNFIFNHTAPINLNFYEEVKKGEKITGGEKEAVKEGQEK